MIVRDMPMMILDFRYAIPNIPRKGAFVLTPPGSADKLLGAERGLVAGYGVAEALISMLRSHPFE